MLTSDRGPSVALWGALIWLTTGTAAAAELVEIPGATSAIEVHGFVSQGAIKTTANNFLAKSERGSVDFTEVGLNFTSQLTDRLRVGVQLFSRHLGSVGNYNIKADWFYLDYRWRDWLGLRAGRVKLPFGLYNDTSDIDSARVPVLLPQAVYPMSNRDFLLAQTGFELYGYVNLHGAGALDYRLYGGTIFLDLPAQPPAVIRFTSLEAPYVVGGRLMWELPVEGLRIGGSVQALRLDLNLTAMLGMPPMTMTVTDTAKVPALLWISSVEYVGPNLLLAAEYSHWRVELESATQIVGPNALSVSERLYGMGSYRVRNWLQPGVYYSLLTQHIEVRSGVAATQHDAAATLRFDVNAHWMVKLEGHLMYGTAGLDGPLNNTTDKATLQRTWGLFLLKTTAYF